MKPDDITKDEEERTIDNEFEALSETKRVYSNTPLNSDHVIAHLNEAKEELITETIFNNDFAYNILTRYATTKCLPKWNAEKSDWEKNKDNSIKYFSLEETDKEGAKKCMKNADRIFNMFMLKTNAIAILSRNKKDNFMLSKGFYKIKDEEQPVQYGADDRSIMERIEDRLSRNDGVEEE